MTSSKLTLGILLLGLALGSNPCAAGGDAETPKQIKTGVVNPDERLKLEKLWTDLEKSEPAASSALLKLGANPAATVLFLKEKMVPLKIEAAKVKGLLAELKSDKEEIWKGAAEQLAYFDPRLAIDLETLMKDVADAPARQRMVAILSNRPADAFKGKDIELLSAGPNNFNFRADGGAWWAEHNVARLNTDTWRGEKPKWTRAVRALALLDHIGTPDATDIIKDMATGHPDAQPTRVAKELLGKGAVKAR